MKLKTYKKTNKNYEDIFEKEKETKEVQLQIGDYELIIAEHQIGMALKEPHVVIITNDCTYSMDFNSFIEKITA